ncbi:hypothetical protein KUTeg_021092 [Tegillarca granosa]|uniref:GON domain-containing protein n=1 Tax=Tegillarca granosa TaxID=220873 RepID=A0ABQ9EAA9_TEGGR|nr:hypothetical protein KUTeg_021092 [Tegillarca granosa]
MLTYFTSCSDCVLKLKLRLLANQTSMRMFPNQFVLGPMLCGVMLVYWPGWLRKNICRSRQECETLGKGLAELGTICDPYRSCSIVEDNGISSAYTIAHELGHVYITDVLKFFKVIEMKFKKVKISFDFLYKRVKDQKVTDKTLIMSGVNSGKKKYKVKLVYPLSQGQVIDPTTSDRTPPHSCQNSQLLLSRDFFVPNDFKFPKTREQQLDCNQTNSLSATAEVAVNSCLYKFLSNVQKNENSFKDCYLIKCCKICQENKKRKIMYTHLQFFMIRFTRFNLPHDSDKRCKGIITDTSVEHVMAPRLHHKTIFELIWTTKHILHSFLCSAGYTECLLDSPNKKYQRQTSYLMRLNPGQVYSVHKQCELTFGGSYQFCPSPIKGEGECVRLWCTNSKRKHGCRTLHMPWADGTLCGRKSWCKQGKCIPMRVIDPIEGGWGKWEDYGDCTRSCGGGIRKRIRKCNNPVPQNGGRYCIGRRIRYRSCNTKQCPPGTPDFREMQCAAYNNKLKLQGLPPNVRWLPKYAGIRLKDSCKLYCRASTSTAYYLLKERVIDGTKCGQDTFDMCVNGKCRRAGCDNRLGSTSMIDRCGICGGDNSSCYNYVGIIPKGAQNINIQQRGYRNLKDDDTFLALRNSSGHYILNGGLNIIVGKKKVQVKDAVLEYGGSNEIIERINGSGPIGENITLWVLSVGHHYPPDVKYSYSLSIDADFTWSQLGRWSKCDRICNGTSRRQVVCTSNDRDQIPVSDSKCERQRLPKPPPIEIRCNTGCTIGWRTEQEECSSRCGEGIAIQRVKCIKKYMGLRWGDWQEEIVGNEHCQLIEAMPGDLCSQSCGGGYQTRLATCTDSSGRDLAENECISSEKLLRKMCNMEPCAEWRALNWTGCSHTCGSGIRHRKVYCYLGDSKVDESRCSILMKPVATESCNHGTCPFWYTGYWEGCSVTCGKGFQTRQVRCQDKHGRHTINSRCSGSPKPSERQTCRVEKCGVWREGPWGECSVTCGEGRVTRQIACFLFDRHRAEERACDPKIRPVGTKPCYAGDCLTTRYYFETTTRVKVISESRNIGTDYWRVGPWSGCSATCEGGWQRRQVVCQDDFYRETNRCNNLTKPEVLRSCDAGPCPGWTTGMWSECSRSCGGDGIQSRRVLCQMVNGRVLPDRMCDITVRPVDRKLCNNGTCHTSRRRWHVPAWSPCSVTCGRGEQQRDVVCIDEEGNVRPSAECPGRKPRNHKVCRTGRCPRWRSSHWSKCSVSCGVGVKTREVFCSIKRDRAITADLCMGQRKPREKMTCTRKKCSSYTWMKGEWSECSKSCGFGTKYRDVTCTDRQGVQVSEDLCMGEKQPKLKRRCSEFPCPYMWHTSPWTKCNVTCGPGYQTRIAVCQGVTKEGWKIPGEVPYGCQEEEKPEEKRSCNYGDCGARYHWVVGPWGKCSARCGWGKERRLVICVDVIGRRRSKKRCFGELRPESKQSCYSFANSCQQLKQQTSIRHDDTYSLLVQGRLLQVFCKNMRKKRPLELRRHANCPYNGTRADNCTACRRTQYKEAGNTSYSKIRLDIMSLKIQTTDITYATTHGGKNIPFGTAGDCYSSQGFCPQGRFSINLSGTGLVVSKNTTWTLHGRNVSKRIEYLQDGALVRGVCGGYCGVCSPDIFTAGTSLWEDYIVILCDIHVCCVRHCQILTKKAETKCRLGEKETTHVRTNLKKTHVYRKATPHWLRNFVRSLGEGHKITFSQINSDDKRKKKGLKAYKENFMVQGKQFIYLGKKERKIGKVSKMVGQQRSEVQKSSMKDNLRGHDMAAILI